ncbi:rRNA maturation RNase YbeY [Mesorhizobium sp. NBSH29]|uniref:rRNA maturation RNase YbeY n=1 Tax=Mesorhizobium sp. NBSH29 TaxID=2654249 RepID=UPI0018967AD3|nr:rRNA maturation RNase YbeY [Mesorhizobium sp. NBSH29]QPC88585.1 rRNA maturation RNase YbeY [Mesorhizobium sp. NBSH29]
MPGSGTTVPLVSIDVLVETGDWPPEPALIAIADAAVNAAFAELGLTGSATELSLVFTDDSHIQALNGEWRGKDKATNVLSFPAFQLRKGGALPPMLGDVILAFETVFREATLEHKAFDHHLSHLLVHGVLHLLGYDHETEDEAEEMEGLERAILARLAICDPYA